MIRKKKNYWDFNVLYKTNNTKRVIMKFRISLKYIVLINSDNRSYITQPVQLVGKSRPPFMAGKEENEELNRKGE